MRLIAFLVFFINGLWAHPHTFIDVFLNITGEKSAQKIEIIWLFDEILMCAFELEKEHIHTSLRYTLKEVSNAYYYGYLLEL